MKDFTKKYQLTRSQLEALRNSIAGGSGVSLVGDSGRAEAGYGVTLDYEYDGETLYVKVNKPFMMPMGRVTGPLDDAVQRVQA